MSNEASARYKAEANPKVEFSGTGGTKKSRRTWRLFERASGNIFNLGFDSNILEQFYYECAFGLNRRRFQYGLMYVAVISLVWILYFAFAVTSNTKWAYVIGGIVELLLAVVFFALTFITTLYQRIHLYLFAVSALIFAFFVLLPLAVTIPPVTVVFNLCLVFHFITIVYLMIPLRLWQSILLAAVVSCLYLIITALHYGLGQGRIILFTITTLLAVHVMAFVLHLMSQVRRRTTFLKLCQVAHIKGAIERERKVKDDMIQSLMPATVADEILHSSEASPNMEENQGHGDSKSNSRGRKHSKDRRRSSGSRAVDDDSSSSEDETKKGIEAQSSQRQDDYDNEDFDGGGANQSGPAPQANVVTFRKFHVNKMKDVSILFADIVGFTKMSSNKTAPQLVYLLNDLFGRFDKICELIKCEKIATLGDCYYSVCGCPQPVLDHAEKCVEMGRSMCVAIQQFDEDHNEEVNMRVGVHTGTVICGIVGTRRFKFDVWSNDVTLANEMESSGEAGRVHISESTYEYVKDIYVVEEGSPVSDIRKIKVLTEYFDETTKSYEIKHVRDEGSIMTYFIQGRKDGGPPLMLERRSVPSENEKFKRPALEVSQELATITEDIKQEDGDSTFRNHDPDAARNGTGEPLHGDANETSPLAEQQKPRTSSDAELVQSLRDQNQVNNLFVAPPVNLFTLNFSDSRLERKYRHLGLRAPKKPRSVFTFATPRVTPLVNEVVNFIFFLLIVISCLIAYGGLDYMEVEPFKSAVVKSMIPSWIFYSVLALSLILHLFLLIPLLIDISMWERSPTGLRHFYASLFSWYPRNVIGALLLATPSFVTLANFSGCLFAEQNFWGYRLSTCLLQLAMVYNLTLFTMYSSWTKTSVASLMVAASLILVCGSGKTFYLKNDCTFLNGTENYINGSYLQLYCTMPRANPAWYSAIDGIFQEMIVALLLTLALIFFLNRDFDISFRLSFNCDHKALMEKVDISREKKLVDWLLGNIIPTYITEEVNRTKAYSRHMYDVGVVFATIANFSDFYDEQFEGGKEMLRVLNEIFADLENILILPKYKDVDKIKTIGSCLMAASGLNEAERKRNKRPDAHLIALMDFCFDLFKTIDEFNAQIFNFNFELKIGYNIGEVTAGVIGTTKLLYDIWGDTVNVASRMYSTGTKGHIQVTEAVAKRLEERFIFEYRDEVFVKGKGNMRTYLVKGKRQPGSGGAVVHSDVTA